MDIVKETVKEKRKKPVKILYEETLENASDKSIYFSNKNVKWQPENWELTLNNIQKMRSEFNAPVDGMGCEKCVDINESPKVELLYQI